MYSKKNVSSEIERGINIEFERDVEETTDNSSWTLKFREADEKNGVGND